MNYAARRISNEALSFAAFTFLVYKATNLLSTSTLSTSIDPLLAHQRYIGCSEKPITPYLFRLWKPMYLWWTRRQSKPRLARLLIAINDSILFIA